MTQPQHALHRAILAVDVEGFGDRARTNPDQVRVRQGLYEAMRKAFGRSGIRWDGCHREDRGDGMMVLVPPDVPKAGLSGDLPRELAAALAEHNRGRGPAAQIRLRMALHAGEVHHDAYGVAGTSVNLAFRLLEASAVKTALARSPGLLVLVVSEWFFEEVIRHDPRSRPGDYHRIRVSVKETQATALICLPDRPDTPVEISAAPPEQPPIRKAPHRNPAFTGRDEILGHLFEALADGGQSPLSPPACVLQGMGGVGKSQIAREFAHRYAADFGGVWWVDAGQPFSIARDLTELADVLEVPQDDVPRRVSRLWRELARKGRWLLIYDNADDEEDVGSWWPTGNVGAVLVTSRSASWELAEPVHVRPFTREESLAFLRRTVRPGAQHAADLVDAALVAGELGGLPLALAQAAAYVTRNRTGWRHYARLLQRSPARVMHLNGPGDYVGTAATTWSLSMSRVAEQRPESAALLKLSAFVGADRIPRDLLRPATPGLPAALRAMADDPVVYDQAIGALAEYALMDATPDTLAVHPLVQAMVRESLTGAELRGWVTVTAVLLAARFPHKPRLAGFWQQCTLLLPHVAAVAGHARAHRAAPAEVSEVCQRAAAYLEARDEFHKALDLLGHALALREQFFGTDSEQFAETLTSQGEAVCYLGHHGTAVQMARRALAVQERVHDSHASSLVPALRLLGRALTENGDVSEAVGVLERAVAICERHFPPMDTRTAEVLARLAYARWRSGDLESARDTYERADRVWRASDSVPDREQTVAGRWLAAVLCDLHDLQAARATIDKAIRMAHDLYGPEHVETVRAEESLGIILAASGDLAGGEHLQRRAATFLREYYPVPVVLAATLTALARTLVLADRAQEALPTAQEAIDLYVRRHGTDAHFYNAGALTVLGMAQRRLGLLREAAESLRRARQIYERAGGPGHRLAEVLAELARIS
jgi:tetratricopeptide (TPR) repeat protein